ncbi:hypothetical protein V1512DRAFT_263944 [Lipomyces arxii]|uniref:uncharacterized protein n=1 Tax=Lipomyces arxii TaxID=56418 RepID=UPI0034CF45D5
MIANSDIDLGLLTAALSYDNLDNLVTRLASSMTQAMHFQSTPVLPSSSSSAVVQLPHYLSATMLPSYIYKYPTGSETGVFVALDVGGSTLRIAVVKFDPAVVLKRVILYSTAEMIDFAVRNLDGRSFFLWIASQLHSVVYVAYANNWLSEQDRILVGLTWSFPLDQISVTTGIIRPMGKGFSQISNDIVGWDLQTVLTRACKDSGLEIDLLAVINDSAATVLSAMQQDQRCKIGLIVGTGVNAGVRVPVTLVDEEKLSRYSQRDLEDCVEFIMDTELSMFGADILPRTRWDEELDAKNENPGFQPFELMVSGRYISEIARYIIRDTILCFRSTSATPAKLDKEWGLDSLTMSAVEREIDIQFARQQFLAKHPCKHGRQSLTIEEMKFIKATFYAVSSRAAAVVAAGILALAETVLPPPTTPSDSEEIMVAVTGSIMEKYFGFKQRVQEFLSLLARRRHKKVVLILAQETGIWGAAVAAACNAPRK